MKQLLLFILCLSFSISAIAQDGSLDFTFNPFDIGKGDGPNDYIRATTLQNDGKIIISGDFTSFNGISINGIARVNTDGSLDTSFDVGTGVNNGILAVAIQADGKVIIGGWVSSFNGISINRIARINTDGSLDTSFNVGTGANSDIEEITIQDDGKILIAGAFSSYNGISINRIARINTDGSLDTSFNVGTGVNASVRSIIIQEDDKVIISGFFTSYNDISINRIARLNTDGSLDTSFNVGTGTNDGINEIVIQEDGKVIIGGSFTNYNGWSINRIARINTDGSFDTTFNIGSGANASIQKLTIQEDDKVIINGYFTSYNGVSVNKFVRLNADGSLDTSFNINNEEISGESSIAIQEDGKVVFGGYLASSFSGYLSRLNTDGSIDTSFNVGYGANNFINDIAFQDDGKIVIAGAFTNYNNMTSNNIARLNTDGSLDTSFNVAIGLTRSINKIAIQDDGKIIIGGYFLDSNYFYNYYLGRLNTDGSLDTSFNVSTGLSDNINDIIIQDDGKIIIGGNLGSYNENFQNGLVRLNTDGSLDTSFNVGTGTNQTIFSIGMQDDGKVIIGGYFSDFNGTSANGLVRLNTDGSTDTSFDIGSGTNGGVFSIEMQDDEKAIISGYFSNFNGISANNLARLNIDGSLDSSFDTGSGVYVGNNVYAVQDISIQEDGKIIIGGNFTSYNGISINRIARLNADGSIDTSFNIGTGANNSIIALGIQDDEQVVAAGSFTSYNGTRKNRIIRINSSNGLHINDISIDNFNIYPNPAQNVVNIKLRQEIDLKRVTIYNNLGKQVLASNKSIINTSNLASGLYLVEVETNKGKSAKKLIVE